jgi:hypothetical protein
MHYIFSREIFAVGFNNSKLDPSFKLRVKVSLNTSKLERPNDLEMPESRSN